jgi:hypothetical protein
MKKILVFIIIALVMVVDAKAQYAEDAYQVAFIRMSKSQKDSIRADRAKYYSNKKQKKGTIGIKLQTSYANRAEAIDVIVNSIVKENLSIERIENNNYYVQTELEPCHKGVSDVLFKLKFSISEDNGINIIASGYVVNTKGSGVSFAGVSSYDTGPSTLRLEFTNRKGSAMDDAFIKMEKIAMRIPHISYNYLK